MPIEHNYIYGKPNTAWKRIYKGSRDGFQPQHFHHTCDGQRNTLTIIQSREGYLFGGYTSVAWDSQNQHICDPQAFIFTLVNPWSISPTRYSIQPDRQSNAIRGNSSCGPIFGYSDICVNSVKQCSFGFPNAYTDTTTRGNQTFTNCQSCTINEIEVYQKNE